MCECVNATRTPSISTLVFGHLLSKSTTAKMPGQNNDRFAPFTQASCVQDLPDHIEAVAKVLPDLRQEIWEDVNQTDPGDRFMVSGCLWLRQMGPSLDGDQIQEPLQNPNDIFST